MENIKFSAFYWGQEFHYCVHRSLPLCPCFQPVQAADFFKTRSNIILPFTTRSSKCTLSIRFPHQNSVCNSRLPHACHVPRPSLIVKACTVLRQITKGKSLKWGHSAGASIERRALWDLYSASS